MLLNKAEVPTEPLQQGHPQIRICEIYAAVEGEGALIGTPSVVVRTGGCDYRCRWCDSLHAVLAKFRDTWKPLTAFQVMERVRETSPAPCLVSLTGGNPALQPLEELLSLGHTHGYRFALETQGSVYRPWFAALDHLCLSPKPPSSGMQVSWPKLCDCINGSPEDTVFKVTVFDEDDYQFARELHKWCDWLPMYLQVGNPAAGQGDALGEPGRQVALRARYRWLAERVKQDNWTKVRVLPQLHVLMYGNRQAEE